MQMPELAVAQQQNLMTTAFAGYNHNPVVRDGEMYDMKNLSGRSYPLLDQRPRRGIKTFDAAGQVPVPLNGISGRDDLIFIRGNRVYYNMVPVVGIEVSTDPGMLPKKIVNMGAYVCIWPDRVYFNTVDTTDYGLMSASMTLSGNRVTAMMCRGDGTNYDYSSISTGTGEPEEPTNGKLWLDTSGENHVLKQYDAGTSSWIEVATTYVKISGTGIGNKFKMYDAVNISGMGTTSSNPAIQKQVQALNGSMILYQTGEDYIVVAGLLSQSVSVPSGNTVKVERPVPNLDYICESNNRLWGCRYGIVNGEVVNEIRACKLGDFRNWDCFMGLSTDSYAASVGSDGPFTGAVTQRSYPIFFKEDCIHRITGSTPATFQLQTTVCRGIQDGSWRSAVVVNEQIYYKSRSDIMMYDGSSIPVGISDALGGLLYRNARAGAVNGKYYISMQDKRDEWNLFVYDTRNKTWYKEDHFHALGFGTAQDELFAIDEDNNTLVSILGTSLYDPTDTTGSFRMEDELEWEAVFGMYGTNIRGTKYLSRFNIRMQMDPGARAELSIQYDGSGKWERFGEIRGRNMKSFLIPVIPRRCDHLQIKLAGKGRCRIHSIGRIMEEGGDG